MARIVSRLSRNGLENARNAIPEKAWSIHLSPPPRRRRNARAHNLVAVSLISVARVYVSIFHLRSVSVNNLR